jgi:hypothetical protein
MLIIYFLTEKEAAATFGWTHINSFSKWRIRKLGADWRVQPTLWLLRNSVGV